VDRRGFLATLGGVFVASQVTLPVAAAAPASVTPAPMVADEPPRIAEAREILRDHHCTCVGCDPSLEVSRPPARLTDRPHYAIRFTEIPGMAVPGDLWSRVYFNGQEVSNSANEAIAGNGQDGWIWRYRGVPEMTSGWRHLCATCRVHAWEAGLVSERSKLHRRTADGRVILVTPQEYPCQQIVRGKVEIVLRPDADERQRWLDSLPKPEEAAV
jgi:hypothetical protein